MKLFNKVNRELNNFSKAIKECLWFRFQEDIILFQFDEICIES